MCIHANISPKLNTCLLEVKIIRIMILDLGFTKKLNPHFFFIIGGKFEIIINGDLSFESFLLITQFI